MLFHNNNEEKRSKKKLYTEKIPNTPEPKSNKKGDAKSTTKKKLKGKTITEMVDNLDGFRRGINDFNPINVSVKNDVGRLSFMASLAGEYYYSNKNHMVDQIFNKFFEIFSQFLKSCISVKNSRTGNKKT